MTHLRIFISSPGDVGCEREIAGRVLTRLQAEFSSRLHSLGLSNSGALDKSPVTIAKNRAHKAAVAPKKSLFFDLFNSK